MFACKSLLLMLFVAPLCAGADEPLTFERDVRPIFKAQCFQCHGEEKELKAGLDLRLVKLAAKDPKTARC